MLTAPSWQRSRHPLEARFIKSNQFGNIHFSFEQLPKGCKAFVDSKKQTYHLNDLYLHFLVTGGSGSGKTYRVLGPLWEAIFQSTHLCDGPKRENLKFAALVIEAKGDFRDKTWHCAQCYGRMDDCIYFGPAHQNTIYDPFGDPAESPLQLAGKMLALLKAFAGGKGSQDPFWDNSAQKLFLNLFTLHRCLQARALLVKDSHSPEEKEAWKIAPMSFQLLNLLLLDRGQPRNQAEMAQYQEEVSQCWSNYRQAAQDLLQIVVRMELRASNYWSDFVVAVNADTPAEHKTRKTPDPTSHLIALLKILFEVPTDIETNIEVPQTLAIDLLKSPLANTSLPSGCKGIRQLITSLFSAVDEFTRAEYGNYLVRVLGEIVRIVRESYFVLNHYKDRFFRLEEDLSLLIIKAENLLSSHAQMAHLTSRSVQPAHGALRRLLSQYENLLKEQNQEVELDAIWAYFNEEYLNVANDKTAGSVAMVASNLVQIFVHGVFKKIFSPQATFHFNQVIDEGKIVYLDMPSAYYGVAAVVASLVFKIDFFRTVLSRRRLRARKIGSLMLEDRFINQDRPLFYFCDEFGSIATTGEETGEAGFTDKCREFKCGCILAVQNLPALQKRIPETEVDHLLSCTATKIFLRNPEMKTNEYASKVLGTEIKVNATVTQSAAERIFDFDQKMGTRYFSTSHSKGARFEATCFPELHDGEAAVLLPPRFRPNHILRVVFAGRTLGPLDQQKHYLLPCTHQD